MNVIIVGAGKLGTTLVEYMARENHDVVLIDNNPKIVETIVNTYDVMGISGNGSACATLQDAGVAKADLFIAVTSDDALNILCCMIAKRMKAKYTIARIRDPQYAEQRVFMRDELGLSMMINPDLEAANEISRMLRMPSALKIETFAKGRVDIIEIKILPDSPLAGVSLFQIPQKINAKVLVCAVQRDDDVIIPSGSFVLQPGDRIHVTATQADLAIFFKEMGLYVQRPKSVMIIGGGTVGYYLTRQLCDLKMKVIVIEQDEHRCEELSEMLPKAIVIHGDGTDQQILQEEGLENVDACVTLTGIDEENIIISLYAKSKSVKKVITKVNRGGLTDIIESLGIDSMITPRYISANHILQYARAKQNAGGNEIKTLYKLFENRIEALEFVAGKNMEFAGTPLKKLQLKDNLLVACIIRANKIFIPDGESTIEIGDNVIVVTTNEFLNDITDIVK